MKKIKERTDVSNMNVDQAVAASTNVKISKTVTDPKIKRLNPTTLGDQTTKDLFSDIDFEIEEGARDTDMGRRIYEIEGVRYRVRQCNPYSLWEVVAEKGGKVPLEVEGKFTNLNELERALSILQARKSHRGVQGREYAKKLEEAGFFDNKEELDG